MRKNKLYNKNLSSISYLKNIKLNSHFIFASSTAIYSNNSKLKKSTEGPFEIYGKSKLDSELSFEYNNSEFKKLPIKGSDANDLSNFLRFIFLVLIKYY